MRNLIKLTLILFLLSGCTVGIKKAEVYIELVEKYVKAVEDKDYATMESLLAENYKGFGPSHSDSTTREAALAAWKENIENLYERISYERSRNAAVSIKDGPNNGIWVSNWAELVITYKNDRGTVTIWANTNYQIENGKIVQSYTFYNEADAMRQLGYVFINPNDY
jgi:hypothetical protein